MEMRQHLLEAFQYNDRANRQVLESIAMLPEKNECVKFFSHLINSQKKWMARIKNEPGYTELSWWNPAYPLETLEEEWTSSLNVWLHFLAEKTEEDLQKDAVFVGFDGKNYAAKVQDIALQLNYHNVHHRAQIQTLIRAQGFEAPFVDYIGTVYKKLE